MSKNEDWILNPLTGRYVKKGGRTHKTLINSRAFEKYKSNNIDNESEESEESEESLNSEYESENKEDEQESESESEEELESESESEEELESESESDDKTQNEPLPNIDEMNDDEINEMYKLLMKFKK